MFAYRCVVFWLQLFSRLLSSAGQRRRSFLYYFIDRIIILLNRLRLVSKKDENRINIFDVWDSKPIKRCQFSLLFCQFLERAKSVLCVLLWQKGKLARFALGRRNGKNRRRRTSPWATSWRILCSRTREKWTSLATDLQSQFSSTQLIKTINSKENGFFCHLGIYRF